MLSIHDSEYCSALRARADKLTPASERTWGSMSVDQMLWHVNGALSLGLGKLRAAPQKPPMPRALFVPFALYLPWPKGKAAAPAEIVASGAYDFHGERARFHGLIEEFASKPLHFNWLDHPSFGRLSGPQWSRLQAKHLDHHFRQFAV